MKEPSIEAMIKGKLVYEPPRYMSASVAAKQLLDLIGSKQNQLMSEDSRVIGLARIGSETQSIRWCTLKEMVDTDLGPPLHSLVIPGLLHPLEQEMLALFAA